MTWLPQLGYALLALSALRLLSTGLNWRAGLPVVLVWLYIEDVVRNLIGPSSEWVLLVKDPFVLWTYLGYVCTHVSPRWRNPLLAPIVLWLAIALIQSLNPSVPSPLVPLVGLKVDFFYIPLMWLGYHWFKTIDDYERLVARLMPWAIVMVAIALLQYVVNVDRLPGELIGFFRQDRQMHSWTGDETILLATSLFRSSDRFARHLALLAWLGLGALAATGNRRKIFPVIACFVGFILSGRRGPVLLMFMGAVLMCAWAYFVTGRLRRDLKTFRRWLAPGIALGAMALILVAFLHGDMAYRLDFLGNVVAAVPERLTDLMSKDDNFGLPLLGTGTGTASGGLKYLPQDYTEMFRQPETGFFKEVVELGWFGAPVVFFVWWRLIAAGVGVFKRLSMRRLRIHALVMVAYFVTMLVWFLKGHQIYSDTATVLHHWLFAGIMLSFCRLERVHPAYVALRRERCLTAAVRPPAPPPQPHPVTVGA